MSAYRDQDWGNLFSLAISSADYLAGTAKNPKNAKRIKDLCASISEHASCDKELEPHGGLMPRYKRLLESGEYESIDELCNAEGLDYEDVYDYDPVTYEDEYCRGFTDCIENHRSPYSVDEHDCTEAYFEGVIEAYALKELLSAD